MEIFIASDFRFLNDEWWSEDTAELYSERLYRMYIVCILTLGWLLLVFPMSVDNREKTGTHESLIHRKCTYERVNLHRSRRGVLNRLLFAIV